MSPVATKYLISTPVGFLQNAYQRMRQMWNNHMSLKKWQQLSLDEQAMISQGIIAEYLGSQYTPKPGDNVRVLWAGCYYRDYPNDQSAIAFAESLAVHDHNLPVLVINSKVKAGWHGTGFIDNGPSETD